MFANSILLSGCLMLIAFCGYTSAAFGDACTADSDCTSDNAVCITQFGCSSKGCSQCATNYVLSSGSCLKDHGQACTGNAECATNVCSTTCACTTGTTWNTAYKSCVTDNKEFGHACGTPDVDADCAVDAAAHGECVEDKCDCASGYIKAEGHVCRKPYFGESECTTAVGCGTRTSDASEAAPECTNKACVCPSTASSQSMLSNGVSVDICITTVTTDQKGSSLECAKHNDCKSNLCYSCPGTPTAAVCVDRTTTAGNNGATQIAIGFLMMISAFIVTGLLF